MTQRESASPSGEAGVVSADLTVAECGPKGLIFGERLKRAWRTIVPKGAAMSPVELITMLNVFYTNDLPSPHTPAVLDAESQLMRAGLIRSTGVGKHETTERGRQFVFVLSDTPLPVNVWKDPREG